MIQQHPETLRTMSEQLHVLAHSMCQSTEKTRLEVGTTNARTNPFLEFYVNK